MSINKPNVGDLFYEALMEALAEEAIPKKESNKQFYNTTIQTPAEFESCEFRTVNLRVLLATHLTSQITYFITVASIIVLLKTN